MEQPDRLAVDPGDVVQPGGMAVRDFQQNENLSVDGVVGTQTWTTLLRRWLLFSQPG
jgi:hypothetical protein